MIVIFVLVLLTEVGGRTVLCLHTRIEVST